MIYLLFTNLLFKYIYIYLRIIKFSYTDTFRLLCTCTSVLDNTIKCA